MAAITRTGNRCDLQQLCCCLLLQVLGNGSVCQQLQDWLASWQRSTAQAVAVQPAEYQQTHESELSPQSWRGSPGDGNWSEVHPLLSLSLTVSQSFMFPPFPPCCRVGVWCLNPLLLLFDCIPYLEHMRLISKPCKAPPSVFEVSHADAVSCSPCAVDCLSLSMS